MKKEVREEKSFLFMNKTLFKAIMVRTKLRNIFLKKKAREIRKTKLYNKIIISLFRREITKRDYYENLNTGI